MVPKRTTRMPRATGRPMRSPRPQVVFRQLVVVVGGAGVPNHEDAEAVLPVRFLDHVEDIGDVFHRVFEGAGHNHGHNRGHAAFGGYEGRVPGLVVIGEVGYDIWAEGGDFRLDRFRFCPKLW